jgi:hypothetical protein
MKTFTYCMLLLGAATSAFAMPEAIAEILRRDAVAEPYLQGRGITRRAPEAIAGWALPKKRAAEPEPLPKHPHGRQQHKREAGPEALPKHPHHHPQQKREAGPEPEPKHPHHHPQQKREAGPEAGTSWAGP